jgi:hypothetical protein
MVRERDGKKSKRADLSTALLGFCSVWDFLRCAVDLFTSRKCARVFAFCARAASTL